MTRIVLARCRARRQQAFRHVVLPTTSTPSHTVMRCLHGAPIPAKTLNATLTVGFIQVRSNRGSAVCNLSWGAAARCSPGHARCALWAAAVAAAQLGPDRASIACASLQGVGRIAISGQWAMQVRLAAHLLSLLLLCCRLVASDVAASTVGSRLLEAEGLTAQTLLEVRWLCALPGQAQATLSPDLSLS